MEPDLGVYVIKNDKLVDMFSALQNEMIADTNLSLVVDHPVDKGSNTEECWIDWFNEYLPKRYHAAKATVIDSNGNKSDQIDIVLYDTQYSYLVCTHKGILYIPAESVYAVFEVKQKTTKSNMVYAGKKAESVRSLYRTSAPIPHAGGQFAPKKLHRILAGVLTSGSIWKEPFGSAFKNCLGGYEENQRIDIGCVLNKGAFSFDYETKKLRTSGASESLVFFFMELLAALQKMGTVPAIDLASYSRALTITEETV